MKKFFLNQNLGLNIELFSIYHFFLILIVLLFVFLIIKNKELIVKLNEKNKKHIRYFLGGIILINFIFRRGSYIYYEVYNFHQHLDINFCNFTSIMFFIYCFTGNKKIYNICYYMAYIGPLISIIIPSVNISPLNYSFYSFIILHHVIFIFNFIFMYIEKKDFNKNDFVVFLIFLVIYFFVIYMFNLFLGTSYNMPLAFINTSIIKTQFINYILKIKYMEYYLMILIILLFCFVAKKVLNFLSYKE